MERPPSSELRRSPPSLRGIPLVRALPSFVRDPLSFIASARAIYGDVYTLDLGVTRVLLLNQPRHAQHVLRDNAGAYRKGGPFWDALRLMLGNGLPVSEGDHWRRQRRMIQPHFHKERLTALTDRMMEAVREGMEGWDAAAAEGKPIDLAAEFTNMTMKVIVRTMFGTTIEREESDRLAVEMRYTFDYALRGVLLLSLPSWLPAPWRGRHREALRVIDEILFRIIERSRSNAGSRDDLISLLLDMVDTQTSERMTSAELRDESVSMFLAGYETTAAALAWATHILTREPDIARALRAEVDAALGGREPGFADLGRLPLPLAILQESLRLYPPAYWIQREAIEDDEIDGWSIPKGTVVAPVVYVIHRHPDIWEDPESFDPGRFSPERAEGRHPLAWMPFGAGQRLCVGKDFAMMEGQLILARIAQRYEIEAVPGREARRQLGTTMRVAGGVWVRLKRR